MDCWGVVSFAVGFLMGDFGRENAWRFFVGWCAYFFFLGIDPEVMPMSILFYARLIRFERGAWLVFIGSRGRTGVGSAGSRRGRAFSVV